MPGPIWIAAPSPATPIRTCNTAYRSPVVPSGSVKRTCKRSICPVMPSGPSAAIAVVARRRRAQRARSFPVPAPMKPQRAMGLISQPAAKKPLITSFAVPSPPTATIVVAPACRAARASVVPSPRCLVIMAMNVMPAARNRRSSAGHARPHRPPPDAGLTITTVSHRYAISVLRVSQGVRLDREDAVGAHPHRRMPEIPASGQQARPRRLRPAPSPSR